MILRELEIAFIPKLIAALENDLATNLLGEQVGFQVLTPAISILQDVDRYTSLSMEQLMIGIMNLAVRMQVGKYGNIFKNIDAAVTNKYLEETAWFNAYGEALAAVGPELSEKDALKIAIPAIEQAAKSPLYLTPCVSHTLKVYFEYLQQLDNTFVPPAIPTGNTFEKWSQAQFIRFHTAFSSSLVGLCLFAVNKHKLPIGSLPTDLTEKLPSQDNHDNHEDTDDVDGCFPLSGSLCKII